MTPSIAIVIPAFNAAATLPRALDSALAQTRSAQEIIVVDDGSTDRTAEIAFSYSPHVKVVQQRNSGPSVARNHGVEVAQADWIAFLDADDWYYPHRLESHVSMIEADSSLDFLVGGFDYRTPAGELINASLPSSSLGRDLLGRHGATGRGVIEGEDIGRFIVEQFSDTRMLTLPRSTFLALGGFPSEFRICEDVVFLLRLCGRSHRAGVTCESGAVYLVHDHGLIRSDRLRAQTESVRALLLQASPMSTAPAPIRAAWRQLVKGAYLDLAFYLAKRGERMAAVKSLARSFAFHPAVGDLRQFVSILRN